MSITKRQLLELAFDELGVASYIFDLQPEQLETALRKLDSMMATWDAKGIAIGYPLPVDPEDSNIDQRTEVPIMNNEAIYLNLALRLAPSYGKQLSSDTRINAKIAYDALLSQAAMPQEKQFPSNTPAGAGHKTWRDINDPFLRRPNTDPLQVDESGELNFLGE